MKNNIADGESIRQASIKKWHITWLCLSIFLLGGCDNHDVYQGYVEGENLYLESPYEGKLIQKHVHRGQYVKKGDLLFELDHNPEALLIEQLKTSTDENKAVLDDLIKPRRPLEIDAIVEQIAQVEANLLLVDLRVKRYQELYKKQAVDLDRLDEVLSSQSALRASKEQLQDNLALAKLGAREDQIKAQSIKMKGAKFAFRVGKWKLEQKNIHAPTDGVIFDTYYQQGEFVSAEHPIAALLPNDQIRIEFFVPARVLSTLQLNQKIFFTCDGCAEKNEATISYISPEAEYVPPLVYSRDNRENLVFRIKAHIEKPLSFKPGQPVIIVGFEHVK
jgi:HlyD family secretion protein